MNARQLLLLLGTAIVLLGCRAASPPAAPPSVGSTSKGPAAPTQPSGAPTGLVSVRVDAAPALDGAIDDAVWARATPIDVVTRRVMAPEPGAGVTVSVRSVHTASHIYFAVSWADETESVTHKSWTWNAAESRYAEGADREDMFALAFELEGPFTGDMLSPADAVWDVWHWKAARTNPPALRWTRRIATAARNRPARPTRTLPVTDRASGSRGQKMLATPSSASAPLPQRSKENAWRSI